MTVKKRNLVPTLRFSEFEGDWIEKPLNKLTQINPKTGNLPSVFIYIDLESVSKGILGKENKIKRENAPSRAQRLLITNDILFQTVRPYQKNNYFFDKKGEYVASTGYAQIRTKQSSKYLYHFLHTEKFVKKVILRCTGTSYPSVNSSDLGKIKVVYPSLPEQQKIASFLTAIDSRIQQLTRKIALLQQYKKGVMQQIFSQQIRFKDEGAKAFPDWKVKKLGEISSSFSGGTPLTSNKDYYIGNIPFIKSGEISSSSASQSISQKAIENSSAKKVKKDDLLYALYGATSGEVAISKIEGAINQAVLCIRTKMNKVYLCNNLKFRKEKITATFLQGGQGNLSSKIVKNLKIPLPTLPEQEKIANFLTAIDEKISFSKEQLDKMQTYKKGLLQQMFV